MTGGTVASRTLDLQAALGHYPTGVVLVTSTDERDEPVGMIVGSFTAVSVDPPLIAYLPSRSSRSFERLRAASRFSVNILGWDQAELAQRFAGREPRGFAGLRYSTTPSGCPLVPGAIAWLECDLQSIEQAGDHWIVQGLVVDFGVTRRQAPLVYLQGRYGRVSSVEAVGVDFAAELLRLGRVGELLHDVVAAASRDSWRSDLVAHIGSDLVVIASSDASSADIGTRMPVIAPVGALFVPPGGEDAWLGSSEQPIDSALRRQLEGNLHRVRERGWSVAVRREPSVDDDEMMASFWRGVTTPLALEAMRDTIRSRVELYDLAFEPGRSYDLRYLNTLVTSAGEEPGIAIRYVALEGMREADVRDAARRLTGFAAEAAAVMSKARTASTDAATSLRQERKEGVS